MKKMFVCNKVLVAKFMLSVLLFGKAFSSSAFVITGNGDYTLRGNLRTNPSISNSGDSSKVFEHNLRLKSELVFNERLSFYLAFSLFNNSQNELFGQVPEDAREIGDKKVQNPFSPNYQNFSPTVQEVYVSYVTDYCLLAAGRKARHWGQGIYLNEGKQPFSRTPSLYDGLSCQILLQKPQTISMSVGFDKIAESENLQIYGKQAYEKVDMNQYYASIKFDDTDFSSSDLKKDVGIYVASVRSDAQQDGGTGTKLWFVDTYLDFYLNSPKLTSRSEFLIAFGESGDLNIKDIGGLDHSIQKNTSSKLNTNISFVTNLEWEIQKSGQYWGPQKYNLGDVSRHLLLFNFAYAPGDADGYYNDQEDSAITLSKRSDVAKAWSFNSNYNVALILFNSGNYISEDQNIDGIFHSDKLINAQVYSLGYRYENIKTGNIEASLIYGLMNDGIPGDVKDYYSGISGINPIGFSGKDLGLELDLNYTYFVKDELELSLSAGVLFPGSAWKTEEDKTPSNIYTIQTGATFHF